MAAVSKEEMKEKVRKFVTEYVRNGMNGTKAAAKVGYTKKYAKQKAVWLLNRKDVQEELAKHRQRMENKSEISEQRIIAEYAKMAFSNITDYLSIETREVIAGEKKDGTPITQQVQCLILKDTDTIDPDKMGAVLEIKQGKDGSLSYKLHDKKGALDSLSKMMGYTKDKVEVTGAGGEPLQIQFNIPRPDRKQRQIEQQEEGQEDE